MPIPPHRAAGDIGHITDHNDVADVLTSHALSIGTIDAAVVDHVSGVDPHGDRAWANLQFSPLGHSHTYPVTSVNGYTGVVSLAATDVGAETPAGAQAKVDALGATVIPLTQKAAANGVATLDGTGKVPSAQLPAGSGVTSVNGMSGAVTLTAANVSAIPTSEKGAASGVASLDISTLVPVAQIPNLDSSKIASGTIDIARLPTGITGTTVSLGNHSHAAAVTSVNSQTGDVVLDANEVGAPPTTRLVSAGTGLTGGGSLAADRTLSVSYGTVSGTSAQGNDSRFLDDIFPLSGYGLLAASGDPMSWGSVSSVGNNDRLFARIWIPAGVAITSLWTPVRIAGTHDGTSSPNALAIYDDAGTKLDQTTDDPTLWTAVGWRGGNIGTPIPAQSTGRFVYCLWICRGVTGASVPYPHNPNDANGPWLGLGVGVTKRRGGYSSGSTIPASFDPTTFGTVSSYMPLIGIA